MIDRNDFIFSFPQLRSYLEEKKINLSQVKLDDERNTDTFNLLIPKYYLDLIDWYDENDPLQKMVISSNLEGDIRPQELEDPIGDHAHSPVPGIIHRYPDRCLLMLTNACAVHCRFCFRKNLLDTSNADYARSLEYIREHPELHEIIFSGGDPFMLTDAFLEKVINELNTIPHVKRVRFHTRVPVVYPKRITPELIRILTHSKNLTISIHINHPREITPELKKMTTQLKQAGAALLSQSVLMKNINDSEKVLSDLFKGISEIGIQPYYLHHLDLAAGTHHFRIPIEEGKKLYQSLRGKISGHAIPEYMLDTPGGHGKIPVMWFRVIGKNKYEAENFEGKEIVYVDDAE